MDMDPKKGYLLRQAVQIIEIGAHEPVQDQSTIYVIKYPMKILILIGYDFTYKG